MRMLNLKENKAITLVALVITIIVLVILAGVSVNLLLGNDGVLERTKEARDETEKSALEEEVKLVMMDRQIEHGNTTLIDDLAARGITAEEVEGIEGAYYVTKGNTTLTVFADGEVVEGKVTAWEGKNDIACPEFKKNGKNIWDWYISTPAQLNFLQVYVNNGNSLSGDAGDLSTMIPEGYNSEDIKILLNKTYVYLVNDIDMGARQGAGTTEQEKWENATIEDNMKWTPIGNGENSYTQTAKTFIGLFDGQNHAIRNVYVDESNSENGKAGIFRGPTGPILNLTVKNSYIKGKTNAGGITTVARGSRNSKIVNSVVISDGQSGGLFATSWSKIENCINEGTTVIGVNHVGGIVGQRNSGNGNVINCKNTGTVIVQDSGAIGGGIIGSVYQLSITISGCTNEGTVQGSQIIGGIIGYGGTGSPTITGCNNSGLVSGKNYYIGGIAGYTEGNNIITGCNNKGIVEGKTEVGGIVGISRSSISQCNNSGTVRSNNSSEAGDDIGGIVGGFYAKSGFIIQECNNSGEITGLGEYTGGIVGLVPTDNNDPSEVTGPTIQECNNTGNINGNIATGGIIGAAAQYKTTVTKCNNKGKIEGTSIKTGGITGQLGRSSTVSYCTNEAGIKGTDSVGGIVGYTYYSTCEVSNCTNTGNTNGTNSVGGIVGSAESPTTITQNRNSGAITAARSRVGGILGADESSSTLTSNTNTGKIVGQVPPSDATDKTAYEMTGGIIGNAKNTTNVLSKNINEGEVIGVKRVGGIAGNSVGSISECSNSGVITGASYVGGIGGNADNITKCYNTGDVTGTAGDGTGGINGCRSNISDISLCYNSGKITALRHVGGITGYLGPSSQETKCYNKGIVEATQDATKAGGVIGLKAANASITKSFYLSGIGMTRGVGTTDVAGADPTNENIATFEEFLVWIEQQP